MKAFQANLVNAASLIIFALWGYWGSSSPSATALIPVFFGIVLLILTQGIKRENKIIAHIAVVLTLMVFIALFKPLLAAAGRSDLGAILRIVAMLITSALAMTFFIKSFIDTRKAK